MVLHGDPGATWKARARWQLAMAISAEKTRSDWGVIDLFRLERSIGDSGVDCKTIQGRERGRKEKEGRETVSTTAGASGSYLIEVGYSKSKGMRGRRPGKHKGQRKRLSGGWRQRR